MFDKDMLKSILAAYGPSGREQGVAEVVQWGDGGIRLGRGPDRPLRQRAGADPGQAAPARMGGGRSVRSEIPVCPAVPPGGRRHRKRSS